MGPDSDKTPSPALSSEDFKHCIQVLEELLRDRKMLSTLSQEERVRLMMAAGKISRPDRLEIMKVAKAHRRNRRKQLVAMDRKARAATQIRKTRQTTVYTAPERQLPNPNRPERPDELNNPQNCYVCKKEYSKLHFFYDTMCGECGDFNYDKRFQTADLTGRVALITGARLKIGYQASLMLLRAGAHVIVTTRFPRDAAFRYAAENDYPTWKDRIQIHGLDLRHSPSVELFTRYMVASLDRLDFLINNAAQTVRRPPGFYRHMMEKEELPYAALPAAVQSILQSHEECKRSLEGVATMLPESSGTGGWLTAWHGKNQSLGIGIRSSAALSQIPYDHSDGQLDEAIFPDGHIDADLQQVDLRTMNSWRLKLADVPTAEMLELQLVNSVAPFILCGKLKPLMLRHRTNDKHVVNVSAMEGKFTRYTKTDKHPHTNMAKAALNMMTLTSAPDYAKDGIFMNAVDTGWVTDEDPAILSARKQEEHDFQPPLDIVDGAARIIDPIFDGINTGNHVYGKFLKDYMATTW